MELRHLRYFIGVADAGGFSAAAERLHTVQPSLSRQIHDLEKEIGTSLFDRSTRHIQLTPAGKVFLNEARLTLAQAERAVDSAREAARSQLGQLTLGFDYGLEAEHLAQTSGPQERLLEPYCQEIQSRPSPMLMQEIRERRLDAAFILLPEKTDGLEIYSLRRDPLLAVMPKEHPLAQRDALKVEELADETFVFADHSLAPVLNKAEQDCLAAHNVQPKVSHEAESLMMALSLVNFLGAVSLLPQYSTRAFPKGVVAIPLVDDEVRLEIGVAWHPENRSAALTAFLTKVRSLSYNRV